MSLLPFNLSLHPFLPQVYLILITSSYLLKGDGEISVINSRAMSYEHL